MVLENYGWFLFNKIYLLVKKIIIFYEKKKEIYIWGYCLLDVLYFLIVEEM